MMRFALLAALALLSACSMQGGSAPLAIRTAIYLERTADGYDRVEWSPEEDCRVVVAHGPNLNEMDGPPSRHCTDEELAKGEALLKREAWEKYPDVVFPSLPPLEEPAADESGAEQSDTDYDTTPPSSTANYPIGYIRVERSLFPGESENRKHFQAGTTGPEAEVIEYFRGLAKKYGAK